MNKDKFVEIVTEKLKLIRTESGYTQDKMAEILGISKKTLVQIEKGRMQAGWTNSIVICTLFRSSEILQTSLGGDSFDLIQLLAHESYPQPKEKTMGGKIWWKDIEQKGQYVLQQNVISQHYRILDKKDYRWFSSFDLEEAKNRLKELVIEV